VDHTFGGDGKAFVNFGPDFDGAYALARAPGGKVVLAGDAVVGGLDSFAIARLTSNGHPDTTFGGDGKVVTKFRHASDGEDLVVHPDGSILLSGEINASPNDLVGVVSHL